MTTRTVTTPYYTQQRWFFAAASFLFILFSLYVYFISASVVQVIARKEVEREIAHMDSHISDLESAYIAAQHAISEQTLAQHGFLTEPTEKIYIEKPSTNLVLRYDED